jgi:hypothetical protein|tara:strand:- start:1942 stop:2307 length:366 start_codon:yes stop_codon:yes gene_type:complete
MKKVSINDGEKLMKVLAAKAWDSTNFKEQLINNPQATLEKIVGAKMTVPDGKKIIIEDQTDPNIIYLNIPGKVDISNFELTEEQLERVSGGVVCGGWCIFGVVVAVSTAIGYFGEGWTDAR